MIDPSLCIHRPTAFWAAFTWQLFSWLVNPVLIIPPLLALIGLPWLIRRLRWKRQISGTGFALLLLYLSVLSPTVAGISNRLLTTPLPADPGISADAIVVLGRGGGMRAERVDVAANLWHNHRAPMIFASGWGDAQEIVSMLEAKEIPQSAVDGEPCSRTTEENARFTAAILQPKDVRRILLVTDPPHMLRSLLTFRSLGFEVIPHPNPLPNQLPSKEKAFLVFREYLGIVAYGLQGRFSPREPSATDVAQAALIATSKL